MYFYFSKYSKGGHKPMWKHKINLLIVLAISVSVVTAIACAAEEAAAPAAPQAAAPAVPNAGLGISNF